MDASILPERDDALIPYAAAFEAIPYAAIIVCPDGRVSAANRAARQALHAATDGLAPAEWSLACLADTDHNTLLVDLKTAASSPHLTIRLPAEAAERVVFRVMPLKQARARLRGMVLAENATPALDQTFANLTVQLRQANQAAAEERRRRQRLAESYTRLEQFSTAATHDLKAPLRQIALLLMMVEEDHALEIPDGALTLLHDARNATARAQQLVIDLMLHARSGVQVLHKTTLCLDQIIAEIETNLACELTQSAGRIERRAPLGQIEGDAALVRQLLANLLGNALKYRAEQRSPAIEMWTEHEHERVRCLHVRDNGIGFDNAQRERLFAPFQRLHQHLPVDGNGIGLATCHTICERHGWRIEAKGVVDQGAEFRIHFHDPYRG